MEDVRGTGRRILLIALPLLTFLAYLPAIRGNFIWDDDRHVSQNLTLRNLRGLEHIWFAPRFLPQWYPITHTSFWLEFRLWGANPLGYHIDNVLLHICNALLLWKLLKSLNIRGAALAATIFALHPIEAESVAWISERKNLLSTFFALLSVMAFRQCDEERWPTKSFLLFAAAMLSKTVACTLPAVLLVMRWWETGRVRWRDALRLLPFFILSAGLGWFTAHTEVSYVGASGADWDLSLLQRCLIASRAIWFYLGKLFWPCPLIFSYPRWVIDAHDYRLFLFPVATLAIIGTAWVLRGKIGRGPLAAILVFIGVLTPALGFFNTFPMRYSFVADHFQYTAGIAIITLCSATIVRVIPQQRLVIFIGCALAVLTWNQAHIYAGPETLWRDVIAKNDTSWLARQGLGAVLTTKPGVTTAELDEATRLFAQVQLLRPQDDKFQVLWGEALFGLGRWQECLPHYQAALKSPDTFKNVVYERMGTALMHLAHLPEAQAMFENALSVDPRDATAMCGLADVLSAEGKSTEALAEYESALATTPDVPAALHGSAMTLLALNRPSEAANRLERFVLLSPADADAHLQLAQLDLQLRRNDLAVKEFAAALSLAPDSAVARDGLAKAVAARAGTN